MVQAVKKIVKTEVKEAFVEDLKKQITEGGTLVMVTYQGLTVEESSELRDKLRAVGGSFRVVKNTMLRRAVAMYAIPSQVDLPSVHSRCSLTPRIRFWPSLRKCD